MAAAGSGCEEPHLGRIRPQVLCGPRWKSSRRGSRGGQASPARYAEDARGHPGLGGAVLAQSPERPAARGRQPGTASCRKSRACNSAFDRLGYAEVDPLTKTAASLPSAATPAKPRLECQREALSVTIPRATHATSPCELVLEPIPLGFNRSREVASRKVHGNL